MGGLMPKKYDSGMDVGLRDTFRGNELKWPVSVSLKNGFRYRIAFVRLVSRKNEARRPSDCLIPVFRACKRTCIAECSKRIHLVWPYKAEEY